MLVTCWVARTPGDVGGPAFAARSAAAPSRSTTGRPVASQRPRRSSAWVLHRLHELEVVRWRRQQRLVDDLHLAGRGGAAAGAGASASAEAEDDGPVSVA